MFKEGHATWLSDPYLVAASFRDSNASWQGFPITDLYPIPTGTINPFDASLQSSNEITYSYSENTWMRDMQLHHENALPEPITIIGNTLYLDQVEAIFISDRERIESLWPDIDLHRNDIFDIMPNG